MKISVRVRFIHCACVWVLVVIVCARLGAAEPRTMVGPGATRDDVINAYGWPTGQSQSGTKEVLTYPQGKVTLEQGRVEKVDFSMTMPWPAPRPRPGPSATPAKKAEEPPVNFWVTDFDAATREAARRNARILAVFTGSDWSQASKLFREQVAFHPDFINEFTGDFVFLEIDFPIHTTQAPELREHNNRLRERYGVTTYPAMLILSRTGTVVARIDLDHLPPGDSYRERVSAALRAARSALIATPPPPEAEPEPTEPAPTAPAATLPPAVRNRPVDEFLASLSSARALVIYGLVAGVLLAGWLLWLVWRPRDALASGRTGQMSTRISDASLGVPSEAEMLHWPKGRLRALLAGLAESEGYTVTLRDETGDVDLALTRAGDTKPRVLIHCVAGQQPPISAKRVRELFASMTAEGVATGWLVAPSGFAPDARTAAETTGVILLNAESLANQLRDLPPLLLPRVLARAARPV